MRSVARVNPTEPWLCAPTITFSSNVMRREQRQVLERAGDAEAGDAVGRDVEQVVALRSSTLPSVGW